MSKSNKDTSPNHEGDDDGYDVGYGKPPKHSQFKSGQSGNPKGGKKPAKTVEDLIFKEASRLVTVKMGGTAVTINKREALVKAIFGKALQGDYKSAQLVLSLLGQADAKLLAAEAQSLTETEIAILKDVFGKQYLKEGKADV